MPEHSTIVLGSDHAGFPLKQHLVEWVRARGHEVIDVGTNSSASVDYPDFAAAVGREVVEGRAGRGIVVCGSGAGACIAANKIVGVRACVCHDTYSAHQAVEHDDMNVLCLGGRIVGESLAEELVSAYLDASFSGDARHQRRVDKVLQIERDGIGAQV